MTHLLQAVLLVAQLNAPLATPVQHPNWHEPSVFPQQGVAKLYQPYKWVSEYRYSTGMPRCKECVGFAALLPAADLGRKIMVTVNGIMVGPLHVIDCVEQKHFKRRVQQGDVVELDPFTWQKLGLDQQPAIVTVDEYEVAHPVALPDWECHNAWQTCPM